MVMSRPSLVGVIFCFRFNLAEKEGKLPERVGRQDWKSAIELLGGRFGAMNLIGTYRTLEEAMEPLRQRYLPEDLRAY